MRRGIVTTRVGYGDGVGDERTLQPLNPRIFVHSICLKCEGVVKADTGNDLLITIRTKPLCSTNICHAVHKAFQQRCD